jgi:hypothetical protein
MSHHTNLLGSAASPAKRDVRHTTKKYEYILKQAPEIIAEDFHFLPEFHSHGT